MIVTHHAKLDVAIQHEADLAATGVGVGCVACAGALCGCRGGGEDGQAGWTATQMLWTLGGVGLAPLLRGCG